jgi:hypothetical protein
MTIKNDKEKGKKAFSCHHKEKKLHQEVTTTIY